MLNSECVRRDGNDGNLLKAIVKKHSRAPGSKVEAGKQSAGVYVPQMRRSSTVADRASAGRPGVSHFAADVVYEINGFVEEPRPPSRGDLQPRVDVGRPPLAGLFADVDESGEGGNSDKFAGKAARTNGAGAGSKKSQRYVAGSFAESLAKLTGLLDETAQSFVRCVKPNHKALKECFDNVIVLDQLRCMGMLELVSAPPRYAGRMDHDMFASRYGILLEDVEGVDASKFADNIDKAKLNEFLGVLASKKFIGQCRRAARSPSARPRSS